MVRVLLAVAVTLGAGPNWAAADNAISVSAGYGSFSLEDQSPAGTALGVEYERGFSSAFSVRTLASGGLYFGDDRYFSGLGVVGLSYQLDALRISPYISGGLGLLTLTGGAPGTSVSAMAELSVGIDLAASERLAYGLQARVGSSADQTSLLFIGLRISGRDGKR